MQSLLIGLLVFCWLLVLPARAETSERDWQPLVTKKYETCAFDRATLKVRRFPSGECIYEAWIRTDYQPAAAVSEESGLTAEWDAGICSRVEHRLFSQHGTQVCLESTVYSRNGHSVHTKAAAVDWQETAPASTGAAVGAALAACVDRQYQERPPEQVVQAFLQWYVAGRMQERRPGEEHDPLLSYAYLQRPELTDRFKAYISAQMVPLQADPVLETQWIQPVMELGSVLITGDTAQVAVYFYRQSGVRYWQTPLLYTLQRQDGQWRIDQVQRDDPWLVVEKFYTWYQQEWRNGRDPLQAASYRQYPALTERYQATLEHAALTGVHDLFAGYSLARMSGAHWDVYEHTAETQLVLKHSDGRQQARLTVALRRIDEAWQIDKLELVPLSAAETVNVKK